MMKSLSEYMNPTFKIMTAMQIAEFRAGNVAIMNMGSRAAH